MRDFSELVNTYRDGSWEKIGCKSLKRVNRPIGKEGEVAYT
jgi:hypothetical protein